MSVQQKSIRKIRKEETRANILGTSASLFSNTGFDQVSIEDIAKKVGVSKGAVFYHFSTKEELGFEVIKWIIEEKFNRIMDESNFKSQNEKLKAIIHKSLTISLEYPRFLNFIVQLVNKNQTQFMDLINQITSPFFKIFVEEFKKRGISNPENKTLLLLAMLDGLALHLAFQVQADEKIGEKHLKTLRDEIFALFFV